jgi:hypothetical protein
MLFAGHLLIGATANGSNFAQTNHEVSFEVSHV